MSNLSKFMGAVAVVAGFVATAAQATPIVPGTAITTPPPVVNAGGDVKAMYIFSDANDASNLLQTIPPVGLIFCNHSNGADGGCSGPPATFTTVDLGVESGPIEFELHNTSTGTTYLSDVASGGVYHAVFTTNFSDITGVTEPAGTVAALAAAGMTGTITFVAWEDRNAAQGTDYDYNDLIFAFSNVSIGCTNNCGVPEPLTLSLFGAGLAGMAAFRRRRKSQGAA